MASTSAITQDHDIMDDTLSGDEEMVDGVAGWAGEAGDVPMEIDDEGDTMDEDGELSPEDEDYMAEDEDDDMASDGSSVLDK